MTAPPYGGGLYIADTSAWNHATRASVVDDWSRAFADGQIATCAPVVLELLFSAQDAEELNRIDGGLAALRDIPVTRSTNRAAIGAMRALARIRPRYHRVSGLDLLTAAAASAAGIGVLHYDRHFDRLAEVLPFESRWIAPPGSLP